MTKNVLLMLLIALMASCSQHETGQTDRVNPFFEAYNTPFDLPPFDKIMHADYLPAFERGMDEQKDEVNAIIQSPEAPDFNNTIEALEKSGALLSKVSNVFNNINSSLTDSIIQQIARDLSPLLSKHSDDINLNPELFSRIEQVYNSHDSLTLSDEQIMLLEKTYKRFVRGGARLNEQEKGAFRKINEELAMLSLKFGENVLSETNTFQLLVQDTAQLAGIPAGFVQLASDAASKAGVKAKWLFTLQRSSILSVLQYASDRSLREKIFKGYIMRGDNNNEFDNKLVAARTAALRAERAKILGYPSHAHFVLEQNMANTPERVNNFVDDLLKAAMPIAAKEAKSLQKLIDQRGDNIKLEPWDWWYYAEILRKEQYDLDEEQLRPYFKLEHVRDGVFAVAGKLWGLQFVKRDDLPKYHPDVEVFEVLEADGKHVGILYKDYFSRDSKRGGAWMNSYRKQSRQGGVDITPVITTNYNFSAPSGETPALLSWDEVTTMFHEMGHALHGLMSNCTYNTLSGTAVSRDFVELPSQIMENWAAEPEVLALYARHYLTGEIIPDELVKKMQESSTFNQGFAMAEFLSAARLDMDWHSLTETTLLDANAFEIQSLKQTGLIPEIVVRYRSTYFSHIFSGGYSAGYYSYIWSEVLDSDAFEAFREKSLFDGATALSFRKNILEKGGTEEPMKMYVAFRGREPNQDALLRKRGLK
ncbi:MAG: M3 family metallopeptidase [Bacteroidales bacterium]|nr:M3 family metallopeptidase [Bacteroidales bacterium]